MITLKLFNAVLAKETKTSEPFVSQDGYVIEPSAIWAKDQIIKHYYTEKLDGNELNKTFHKSWKKILNSTRLELAMHQIMHYFTTYGSDFQGEIYIPDEVLNVPDAKVVFKVIRGLTKDELTTKCLDMLKSGIALKEDIIRDLLALLHDELDYAFTGKEGITNKEAIIQLADVYNVYPDSPTEFLRFIIYKSTGSALLIKNRETINTIKSSTYNPTVAFKQYGLERLSEIFNRFKPIFLAYKNKSKKTVNKIAKLSKTHHKPMVQNALNCVTQNELTYADIHWLDNATPYALFKALSACYGRLDNQDSFLYRIRNGKSWVKTNNVNSGVCYENFEFLRDYLKARFDFSDKVFYIPKDIEYALPTSEKMFVGNIPTGTKFYGKNLAVGVYWENDWGANDLDLSGILVDGSKVGWNSDYRGSAGTLLYSGDITSAPNGAVEYLYAHNGLKSPVLVNNNVFNGIDTCNYKIIVGRGSSVDRKFMMDPNKLFLDVKSQSIQKQTILGMFLPENDRQSFVILNFGAGHTRVSSAGKVSDMARNALFQRWKSSITFNSLIEMLGGTVIRDVSELEDVNDYVDLSLDKLERDTFVKIFKK
jgi:hypothetical protein